MLRAATHFLVLTHDSAQWWSHATAESQKAGDPDERLSADPGNDSSKDQASTDMH